MGLLNTLKELLGFDSEHETRRHDVSVSVEHRSASEEVANADDSETGNDRRSRDLEVNVERRDSRSSSEPIENSESLQETDDAENESSGQIETTVEDEPGIKESDSSPSAKTDNEQSRDVVEENDTTKRSPEDSGEPSSSLDVSVQTSEFAELTGFKRDLLILIRGMETPKGTEIMEELEGYYGENVNHGRLYPNLDDLVEGGYVEKISLNARSNGYNLTDKGKALLVNRQQWVKRRVGPLGEMNAQPNTEETSEFDFEHEEAQTSTESRRESDQGGESEGSSYDQPDDSELVDDIMDGFDDLGEETNE